MKKEKIEDLNYDVEYNVYLITIGWEQFLYRVGEKIKWGNLTEFKDEMGPNEVIENCDLANMKLKELGWTLEEIEKYINFLQDIIFVDVQVKRT